MKCINNSKSDDSNKPELTLYIIKMASPLHSLNLRVYQFFTDHITSLKNAYCVWEGLIPRSQNYCKNLSFSRLGNFIDVYWVDFRVGSRYLALHYVSSTGVANSMHAIGSLYKISYILIKNIFHYHAFSAP